jgi:hypothetical protein
MYFIAVGHQKVVLDDKFIVAVRVAMILLDYESAPLSRRRSADFAVAVLTNMRRGSGEVATANRETLGIDTGHAAVEDKLP